MSRDVEPKQTRRSLGTRPAKGGTPKTKARCPSQTASETEQPQKGTGFLLHGKRSRTFYSKACCLAWQVQLNCSSLFSRFLPFPRRTDDSRPGTHFLTFVAFALFIRVHWL